MGKPNILLFMVDQLTAFVLSAYGGAVCKTPNIDRLAARGTVFENAYCNYPLCAPSRFSMMSGRLPSRIGAYDNGAELPAATPTFAHYLRLNGYHTCLSGKMHFVGPDQFHGFEDRLTTEIYPADMSWTPDPQRFEATTDKKRTHEFGVSTIDTVRDAGPVSRSMQIDYDEEVVHCAIREIYDRARGNDERPFMMTVSLTHPHDPYVTTPEFWDLYADADPEDPHVPHIPVEERDAHSQSLYFHYGQDACSLSDKDYKRARRGYYGMISYIDQQLGRVTKALETAGYAENTTVIFTSDHGDMIGERGMWFKKTLFEPAINVPLILAMPGQRACREAAPVSLVDIFPTVCEIAGVPLEDIKTPLDGRSLLPAVAGRLETCPVFVEHIDGGTPAPRVCVREGNWKLVCSNAYATQLFNLSDDPLETNDLAGQGLSAEERLTKLAQETWRLDVLAEEVMASQTARKLVDAALATGRPEPWDFVPKAGGVSTTYVRRGDAFPEVERRGYLGRKDD